MVREEEQAQPDIAEEDSDHDVVGREHEQVDWQKQFPDMEK